MNLALLAVFGHRTGDPGLPVRARATQLARLVADAPAPGWGSLKLVMKCVGKVQGGLIFVDDAGFGARVLPSQPDAVHSGYWDPCRPALDGLASITLGRV